MSDTVVLFHADCTDGFCSAWIAQKVFGTNNDVDYIPVHHGNPPPDVKGKTVYLLDFSYKQNILRNLIHDCDTMVLIDHHKTAIPELAPFFVSGNKQSNKLIVKFDLEKSGAMLTWEHFYPTDSPSEIVSYVQDRDLWNWRKPYSKEINAAIASYLFDFDVWDTLEQDLQQVESREMLVKEGVTILRYQRRVVESACKNAVEIELDGYKVLSMNTTTMISEIGEQLSKDRPFSATYFIRGDGKKIWSLRSRPNEKGECVDVSVIAKNHGGGGHKQAAGFQE